MAVGNAWLDCQDERQAAAGTIDRRNTVHARPATIVRSFIALTALGGGLVTSGPVSAGGDGANRTPSCRGQAATHVNEDGGPGNDVIIVTTPGLEVDGWNGDDLICVSTGRSGYGARVDGGNGNDTIITYSGENFVYGGGDDDSLLSNSADHLLDGEDDDFVMGFDGNDHIVGGTGDDHLEGGSGSDLLDGGSDDDTCVDVAAPATTYVSCETVVAVVSNSAGGFAST